MTPTEIKAEMQKCKESPFYFYDQYVTVKGAEKMTEEVFNDRLKLLETITKKKLL